MRRRHRLSGIDRAFSRDRPLDLGDPLMREIRYLDKLIDELANGKAMEKILRK